MHASAQTDADPVRDFHLWDTCDLIVVLESVEELNFDPAGGSPEEVDLVDGREHNRHLADTLRKKTIIYIHIYLNGKC